MRLYVSNVNIMMKLLVGPVDGAVCLLLLASSSKTSSWICFSYLCAFHACKQTTRVPLTHKRFPCVRANHSRSSRTLAALGLPLLSLVVSYNDQ